MQRNKTANICVSNQNLGVQQYLHFFQKKKKRNTKYCSSNNLRVSSCNNKNSLLPLQLMTRKKGIKGLSDVKPFYLSCSQFHKTIHNNEKIPKIQT